MDFESDLVLDPSEPLVTPLVFGTYRLKGEVLDDSASQALRLFWQQGRPLLLDGASKYRNTDMVLKIMKKFPGCQLGWKVDPRAMDKNLKGFVEALADHSIPHHRIFRIYITIVLINIESLESIFQ